ncbi:hypothetical protein PG984_002505 [Apiospora sp. TS-2023a]
MLESKLSEWKIDMFKIANEAFTIPSARTETTSLAISAIDFHLLNEPLLLKRLGRELLEAGAEKDSWHERLPFLGIVIQEGLRLPSGMAARTACIATGEVLLHCAEWNRKPVEYIVSKGYAVDMSTVTMHHNENVFLDSYAFVPER